MLNVGLIGYGRRVSGMAKLLGIYGMPYRAAAIADPRVDEIAAANDPFLRDANYYADADELLANEKALDGYKGTIHFDWYENKIHVFKHQSPTVETIDYTGDMPHFGGDRELVLDFIRAMRDHQPSRSTIQDGILSALTCLWARESAATRRYCQVIMPA